MTPIYIGIGSNLANPKQQVGEAIKSLNVLPESRFIKSSPLYRSAPIGPADQPDYVNAVCQLETRLEPLNLLDCLQEIEQKQGRTRTGLRWGPRVIDLDLLLYGQKIISHERLIVPHPGLYERCFVLYPLSDISPDLDIPGHGPVSSLKQACTTGVVERIGLA